MNFLNLLGLIQIRTHNNDRENRPKNNYNDIEKHENEDEGNFEKPRFVNSQLEGDEGNHNMKELETKGDLFLEKFKKLEDSSKGIEKVEKRKKDDDEDVKEGEGEGQEENNAYYKRDSNNNKEDIIKAIIKAIDENNLLDVYKYIKQYINDINEIININGEEYGFLHYCAGKGTIQMVKLLCTLGADINKEDIKGLKPIIYAKLNKNVEIIDFLNKKDKI